MKWIDVKESLPPPGVDEDGYSVFVLITNKTEIGLGYHEYEYFGEDENDPVTYSSPSWYDATHNITDGVTHWMELPELPE